VRCSACAHPSSPKHGIRQREPLPIKAATEHPGDVLLNKIQPRLRYLAMTAAMAAILGISGAVTATPALPSSSNAFFTASVLSQPIPVDAPIAPNSDELVTELRNEAFGVAPDVPFNCREAVYSQPVRWTADEQRWCHRVNYLPGITTDAYAPTLYTVGTDQPTVKVVLDNQNVSLTAAVSAVPIPDGASPAPGTDGQMVIWQPSTDTMWEFWRARKLSDGWHAGTAGRIADVSTDPGHYLDIPNTNHLCSADPAVAWCEQHWWGGPASKIPNLAGLMTLSQLQSGHIDHTLSIGIPDILPGRWVWPAQSTDGSGDASIPMGARFRIDPQLDLDAWFASLRNPDGTPRPVPPILRMIAEAAQTYGLVVTDSAGGVAFYGENWHDGGSSNAYDGSNGLFGGLKPWQFVVDLPWEHMQALAEDTCDTAPVAGEYSTPCAVPPSHVTVPLDRMNLPCAPPVSVTPQQGDTSGPFVQISSPVNGSTLSGWQKITAFASDPSGVDRVEFYVDGDLRYTSTYPHCALGSMQYVYGGFAGLWDTGSEITGTHTIAVHAIDALGNTSIDRIAVATAPYSPPPGGGSTPSPVIVRPSTAVQRRRTFPVEWAPTPAASPLSYDIERSVAPIGKPLGPAQMWLSRTPSVRSAVIGSAPGSTYCFSARAETASGQVSPWSGDRCTAVPIDDRSLTARRGHWRRAVERHTYMHTVSVASKRGAELARGGLLAKSLSLVATKCAVCGSIEVYWNGKPIRRIDLTAKRVQHRAVIALTTFSAPQPGRIVIRVESDARPVRIDGLAASVA
jgi:hypothetical protein